MFPKSDNGSLKDSGYVGVLQTCNDECGPGTHYWQLINRNTFD